MCGGDNSTCQLTTVSKRAYTTGAMTYGYNHIVTLPINASSVLITQTSIDDRRSDESYLAVSVRAEKNEKNYLFNGRYSENNSRLSSNHRCQKYLNNVKLQKTKLI